MGVGGIKLLRKYIARIKMIELGTAIIALWWFVVLILPFDTFDTTRSYSFMHGVAPEWAWALVALAIGLSQLIGLFCDKQRLRIISVLMATSFWAFVSSMFAMGDWYSSAPSTASGTYAVISMLTAWVYVRLKVGGDRDRRKCGK